MFLLFFYQGCQVTYKIINPYYKGLKVKRNISQQYILSQIVSYQDHKVFVFNEHCSKRFDSPFFFYIKTLLFTMFYFSKELRMNCSFFIENTVKSL